MGRQLTLVFVGDSKSADQARDVLRNAQLVFEEVDIRHNGAAAYLTRDFGPGASLPLLVVDGAAVSGLAAIQRFAEKSTAAE